MKNIFSFFRFATQRMWRIAIVLTAILIIWHITLINSDIPYINHPISWLTTLLCPFFAIVGCNAIYWFYVKKGHIFGEGAAVGVAAGGESIAFGGDMGEAAIALIAIIVFIALLPIIIYFVPAECFLGALYYKGTIWQEIVHAWHHLTTKQSIFIITKACMAAGAFSFLVWEVVAHVVQYLYKVGVFVVKGNNSL